MTQKEIFDLRLRALARLVELHEENEFLKKELKARRRQADVWRKKYQRLQKERKAS